MPGLEFFSQERYDFMQPTLEELIKCSTDENKKL
ncbi:MAG: hypothetical protein LEGION0403_FIIPPAGN_00725 [Legionella sp.]